MWDGITPILLVTVVISSSVVCFPLPIDETSPSEATPLLAGQDDGTRVPGEVLLVRAENQKQGVIDRQSAPESAPPGVLRPVLAPVDTLVENEIWQYRYPPFDTLFDNPADDEAEESESAGAATTGGVRSQRFDSLPSYVIGILDPAELVDGLFQQRPFRSNVDVLSNRNSVPDFGESNEFNDDGFNSNRRAKLLGAQQPNKVFGVPRIVLEADDRWIWRSFP